MYRSSFLSLSNLKVVAAQADVEAQLLARGDAVPDVEPETALGAVGHRDRVAGRDPRKIRVFGQRGVVEIVLVEVETVGQVVDRRRSRSPGR